MVWVVPWWRKDAIKVGRQEGVGVLSDASSLNRGSGIAYQHLRPIEYKSLRPEPRSWCRRWRSRRRGRRSWRRRSIDISSHVIAIGPDTEFHITDEAVGAVQTVSVP